MDMRDQRVDAIKWEISVPIFRNPIILRQLALAIGLPFGIILIILIFSAGDNLFDARYAIGLVIALLLITMAFVMVFYGGKYDAGFIIDNKGIFYYTQKKQEKKNRIINILTIILGLLSRNPTAAGAGVLAQSRQSVLLRWEKINKVSSYPKWRIIMVRGEALDSIAVFCMPENYSEVEALVRTKLFHLPF